MIGHYFSSSFLFLFILTFDFDKLFLTFYIDISITSSIAFSYFIIEVNYVCVMKNLEQYIPSTFKPSLSFTHLSFSPFRSPLLTLCPSSFSIYPLFCCVCLWVFECVYVFMCFSTLPCVCWYVLIDRLDVRSYPLLFKLRLLTVQETFLRWFLKCLVFKFAKISCLLLKFIFFIICIFLLD